jgi:hypothetical protein
MAEQSQDLGMNELRDKAVFHCALHRPDLSSLDNQIFDVFVLPALSETVQLHRFQDSQVRHVPQLSEPSFHV